PACRAHTTLTGERRAVWSNGARTGAYSGCRRRIGRGLTRSEKFRKLRPRRCAMWAVLHELLSLTPCVRRRGRTLPATTTIWADALKQTLSKSTLAGGERGRAQVRPGGGRRP